MNDQKRWWSWLEERRRNDLQDFDERSRASLLLSIRDAFFTLVLLILLAPILASAFHPLPPALTLVLDSPISPVLAFLAASLVGFGSWVLRRGITWRILLWTLPIFLLSGALLGLAKLFQQHAELIDLPLSVYSLILIALGLAGLLIALARWQRWPLPRVLQGPTAQPYGNAGRMAVMALLLILLALLVR